MDLVVKGKIGLASETFTTLLTFKWLLSSMDSKMPVESSSAPETLSTQCAFEGFLVVSVHVTLLHKISTTHGCSHVRRTIIIALNGGICGYRRYTRLLQLRMGNSRLLATHHADTAQYRHLILNLHVVQCRQSRDTVDTEVPRMRHHISRHHTILTTIHSAWGGTSLTTVDVGEGRLHPVAKTCINYQLEQLERLRSEEYPRRLMITHTIESRWVPNQNKVEWPGRYRSRAKVITCDTPSHASDHLCQIWKESIRNCRCYRADTIFKAKAKWPWRYRSRSKVIICNTPPYTSDHVCQIWKESIENCRFFFSKSRPKKFKNLAKI